MQHLRLVFMGTPAFSVSALHALHAAGHTIPAVYSQPPKPQGRGHDVRKTPVHEAAEALGLAVRTPTTLKSDEEVAFLTAAELDVIVVAAYGLLLPPRVLEIPRLGCVNIHASLLPRWRGAAPIQRAILAGDTLSGVTIMQMEAGLDTGPMWATTTVPITEETTAASLHDALAREGAALIAPTLDAIAHGTLAATPQPVEGVTYAAKLSKTDGFIDWTRPARDIERQIRALTPWPGTFFTLGDATIKVLGAHLIEEGRVLGPPGTLLDDHMTVACAEGALRLLSVQRPGKAVTDGAAFLRGARLVVGTRLV
jgi:methionyl-tRNA formyltransferase